MKYPASTIAVDVTGLSSGVSAIAVGKEHSCALTLSGAVKCWGDASNGQLGEGYTTSKGAPVDVVGLSSDVVALTAGNYHNCALMKSGGVKCWGSSYSLGDGSFVRRNRTPVDVAGVGFAVKEISAGSNHTCALMNSGAVKCWGKNEDGQLGIGHTSSLERTPVDVEGLSSGVQSIATKYDHTCALTLGKTVKCWGMNTYGEVGNGTNAPVLTPVDVAGLAPGSIAVVTGESHTCALTATGTVKCWGGNGKGQLGSSDAAGTLGKIQDVTGLDSEVKTLAAGAAHTCAITAAGPAKCWGFNTEGQLGNGKNADSTHPVPVTGANTGIAAISVAETHSCSRSVSGAVKCWGRLSPTIYYNVNKDLVGTPTDFAGVSPEADFISVGFEFTCAVTRPSGAVKCWGRNTYGQLGDGTTSWSKTPVDVVGLGSGIKAVATGESHACALTTAGAVKCWGSNAYGQLGNNSNEHSSVFVEVVGLSSGVIAIAAGGVHSCALLGTGKVKCWGRNTYGQIGNNSLVGSMVPEDVSSLTDNVKGIAAGGNHSCAITNSGAAMCWGKNFNGQLGDGTSTAKKVPVQVAGLTTGVASVSAGANHTCIVTESGAAKCWGEGTDGQLGNGQQNEVKTATDVNGMSSGIASLSAGRKHTCAVTTAGAAFCWGKNFDGQLGNADLWSVFTPQTVLGNGCGLDRLRDFSVNA